MPPARTLTYPPTPATTVHRYAGRATYDLLPIHTLVNECSVLHVSFLVPDSPFPATLPMIGVMGSFDYPSSTLDEPLDCYLHGYVSSRIMNLARTSKQGSSAAESEGEPQEQEQEQPQGIPLTISATKVSGLVLSLTPNTHSYNYSSAVLQGYGEVVTNEAEKLYAMRLVTNGVIASRWENSRTPPDAAELASTALLRVRIVAGSGKVRKGGPGDEKKDLERDELKKRIWTGVVPVWEQCGEPVKGGAGEVGEVPDYLAEAVRERNERARTEAMEALKAVTPPKSKGQTV